MNYTNELNKRSQKSYNLLDTNTMKLLFSMMIFMFATNTNAIFAQKKKVVVSQKSKIVVPEIPQNTTTFSNVEFQTNIDKLSPNFGGNDSILIYESLEKRQNTKGKGEFETTEQYKLRLYQDTLKPLVDSLSLNSKMAFVDSVNNFYGETTNLYDADTQIMTYKLTPTSSQNTELKYKSGSLKFNCFDLDIRNIYEKEYSVSNGYGNKTTVKKTITRVPSLEFENWGKNQIELIQVKLPIEKAVIAKTKSRILFVGELVSPYFSDGYLGNKPTIETPNELSWLYYYLHLKLTEIWIFNQETGEIYAKENFVEKKSNSLNDLENTDKNKVPINPETELEKADKLYKEGHYDLAMASVRKVLNIEPMSSKAYLILGKIHTSRNDLEQAVSSFKTVLFWDNTEIEAYISLCRIFIEKKDCLTAKRYAETAMQIDNKNPEVIGLQNLIEQCKN